MGSLLLDGGIKVADRVFSLAFFGDNPDMKKTWDNLPPHPLQEQEPLGDRQWIDSYQMLKELTKFEEAIGISFRHIRLLARAFTDRSIGYTHLTLGSNQRLEFLGDTVLQLICSEFLYRHFPEHHEGHLSLLRSSLVNNRTQSVVCDDLGMTKYAVYTNPKPELKTKDRADLLEAFLGALYVDRGLEPCQVFCQVCLFPRLQQFIMNQDWNDPKSKLQQCCLTLRAMDGGEPDIPVYKVIECVGPTNTRVYTVAVYFRGKRLASATGHSIQQAEMNAAKAALENSSDLFPQLDYQKRVIAQSIKRQRGKDARGGVNRMSLPGQMDNIKAKVETKARKRNNNNLLEDESNLPKQYRMREDISSDELHSESDDIESKYRKEKIVSKIKSAKVITSTSDDSESDAYECTSHSSQNARKKSQPIKNTQIKTEIINEKEPIKKTAIMSAPKSTTTKTPESTKTPDSRSLRFLSCSSLSSEDDNILLTKNAHQAPTTKGGNAADALLESLSSDDEDNHSIESGELL